MLALHFLSQISALSDPISNGDSGTLIDASGIAKVTVGSTISKLERQKYRSGWVEIQRWAFRKTLNNPASLPLFMRNKIHNDKSTSYDILSYHEETMRMKGEGLGGGACSSTKGPGPCGLSHLVFSYITISWLLRGLSGADKGKLSTMTQNCQGRDGRI